MIKHVTNGDWRVSYQGLSPVVILHVYKIVKAGNGYTVQKSEHYGKEFTTQEAATKFALEHGYLKLYQGGKSN